LENVSPTRTSRPEELFSFCGVLCVFLAIMVFAWGTNYKLSLYKAGHEGSPAKVCTRGSDAAKNAVAQSARGGAAAAATEAPSDVAVLSSLVRRTETFPVDWLRDEAVIDRSPLSRAPILYLRPPPDERFFLD